MRRIYTSTDTTTIGSNGDSEGGDVNADNNERRDLSDDVNGFTIICGYERSPKELRQ